MPQTSTAWAAVIAATGMGVLFYEPRAAVGIFIFAGLVWFIGKSEGK
jgi:hypothetical protein